ncbi:UNVERIFIED_CONTAM: hypothetical protein GTU68_045946 [Idotea baltica]|nr:hypothetical protein [Idotea baltica]
MKLAHTFYNMLITLLIGIHGMNLL